MPPQISYVVVLLYTFNKFHSRLCFGRFQTRMVSVTTFGEISTFYSIPKHMDTDVIGDLVDKLKVIQNDDVEDFDDHH
ncbi:hypothetical protein JHK87_030944 [Glycine soja]|nr:hypothetical protein JHK87_030944 [Glycine soja]